MVVVVVKNCTCIRLWRIKKEKMPFSDFQNKWGLRWWTCFVFKQLAKTSAKLANWQGYLISRMYNPNNWEQISMSYAMLGIKYAGQVPLIGFAGPRVVKKLLEKNCRRFQTSEFCIRTWLFVDFIVHKNFKNKK